MTNCLTISKRVVASENSICYDLSAAFIKNI